jgi:hypothetical protein
MDMTSPRSILTMLGLLEAILFGEQPSELTLSQLMDGTELVS